MKQLDLLTWIPPRKVVAFPMGKRVGKIRRVAEVLLSKRGKASDHYWKTTINSMADQMTRAGVDPDAVKLEILSFRDAVERELRIRAGQDQRPGGSAA